MKKLLGLFLVTLLTACGTTSGLQNTSTDAEASMPDLSGYNSVVVLDFEDGTKKKNLPEYVSGNFAARIVSELKGTGIFTDVGTTESDAKSIIIKGDITRYAEGNAALRGIVGFGAGSSYFDAVVKLYDSTTNQSLGEIIVDKNSWVLGGFLAAAQSVESFMNGAAKKVADEMKKSKEQNLGKVN